MFTTVLLVLVCAAIGAYIRYEARESRRPWLVTVVLAAVFLVLTFLKPRGRSCWPSCGALPAALPRVPCSAA